MRQVQRNGSLLTNDIGDINPQTWNAKLFSNAFVQVRQAGSPSPALAPSAKAAQDCRHSGKIV